VFDEPDQIKQAPPAMQFHRVVCLFVLATLTNFAGESAPAPQRTITLEECITLALQHNLDLQIQRYNPQIAVFNLRATYGAYDPTFSAAVEHGDSTGLPGYVGGIGYVPGDTTEYDSVGGGVGGILPWGTSYRLQAGLVNTYGQVGFVDQLENTRGSMGAIELRQKLLKDFWTDATRYQIAVQKNALKGSEWGVRGQIMSTLTAVESAYYALIYAFDEVKVQEKAVELAEKLLAENKKRVEVGAMAPLDEKQAEAQLAASRADLLTAQRNLAVAQNTLKSLLTDDYSAWHALELQPAGKLVAVPVALDVQDSWMKGMVLRPDLQQARLSLENSGLSLRLANNQVLPSFDIVGALTYGASASYITDTNGVTVSRGEFSDALEQWANRDAPSASVGFEFSMPLGNQRARNERKTARLQKEQAGLQLKQLEQNAMVQIDNAITLVRTSLARTQATREARVFSEAALDAEVKKLENGKSTSFEVLRLQRDLTSARSMEIQALTAYNVSLAQLALAEGTTLERHKLDFAIK
jgi:outer membrane protein TolC